MKKISIENDPKIETGFIVPDHYFENFSANLITQVSLQEPKVVSLFARYKTLIYASAAIIVFGISVPMINNYYVQNKENETNILENYITYQSTISENDILDLLDLKDLENMNIDTELDNELLETELNSNNNLEQYILN